MGRPKLTTNEVITRFISIHGDKYDYSKLNYAGAKSKMIVICPKHGEFDVILDKHMLGGNCPKCVNNQYHLLFKKSSEDFITTAKLIHDNKYDYSKVKYVNNKTKVTIICPIHGDFEQRASSHLSGYGCSMCKESFGEREIRNMLEKNRINFSSQHRFYDCKYKKLLPFDFYLSELNTCIEYQGKQHYEHNHFFVSKNGFEELKERDRIKEKYCLDNQIKLITIKYDENIYEKLTNIL